MDRAAFPIALVASCVWVWLMVHLVAGIEPQSMTAKALRRVQRGLARLRELLTWALWSDLPPGRQVTERELEADRALWEADAEFASELGIQWRPGWPKKRPPVKQPDPDLMEMVAAMGECVRTMGISYQEAVESAQRMATAIHGDVHELRQIDGKVVQAYVCRGGAWRPLERVQVYSQGEPVLTWSGDDAEIH